MYQWSLIVLYATDRRSFLLYHSAIFVGKDAKYFWLPGKSRRESYGTVYDIYTVVMACSHLNGAEQVQVYFTITIWNIRK